MEIVNVLISLCEENSTNYLILLELLIRSNKPDSIHLYILGEEKDLQSYQKVYALIQKYGICYDYISISIYKIKGLSQSENSILFCPYFLSQDVKRVLFLNANLLIRGTLKELWNFSIGKNLFAACEDRGISKGVDLGELERVHITETETYYNTDVLLMNITAIKEKFPEKYLENFQMQSDDSVQYGLKSFINKYFAPHVLEIKEKKYNTQIISYRKRDRKAKYDEAIIINYENINMQLCNKDSIGEETYDLWWNCAKYFGIKGKKEENKTIKIIKNKVFFSVNYFRFAIKKLVNRKISSNVFGIIDLLNGSDLWNPFYFMEKKFITYTRKYHQLTEQYKLIQVHQLPVGGAASFFLGIICYKIFCKEEGVLHILIPATFMSNSSVDNPEFYVHNEAVLNYMEDAYIPGREDRKFLQYILSKYFYSMDFTQYNLLSPSRYENMGGTYEEVQYMHIINFSLDDEEKGDAFIHQYGIGDRFVCIAPRSNDYKKVYLKTVGVNDYLNYRNGTIESYLKAVDVIKSEGFNLVQMGKLNRKSFPEKYGILNFSKVYNEFIDLYLFSKCKFVIGDSSGIMNIANLFGKFTVQANWEVLTTSDEIMGCIRLGKDILLPVKYWNEEAGHYLGLKEQLALEVECKKMKCRFEEKIIELGYKGISNSDEELKEAAEEMIINIIGGKEYTEEERKLQDFSRNLIQESARKYHMRYPRCNIAVGFLIRNRWYLE